MVIVKQRKKELKIIHKRIKPCKKLQGFFNPSNPRIPLAPEGGDE